MRLCYLIALALLPIATTGCSLLFPSSSYLPSAPPVSENPPAAQPVVQPEIQPEIQPEEPAFDNVPDEPPIVEPQAEEPIEIPVPFEEPVVWDDNSADTGTVAPGEIDQGSDPPYVDPCADGSCDNPNQPVFAPEKLDPSIPGTVTDPNPATSGLNPLNW